MEELTEKVKHFLEKHNLLNSEEEILIAFSGGYDSMCLLDVLSKLHSNIIAIHLNHNWRSLESDTEEENCRNFCNNRNIKFYTEKLSNNIKKTETAAREARYEFFENCAHKFNSQAVLTAHNANDNAETVLYRILKGTGITGLSGIAEKRGIYYRPLLQVKRGEIEEYCKIFGLKPNEDSSNQNIKYKRNLIRKNILPELEKINSSAIDMINSLSQTAQNDNEIIKYIIAALDKPYKIKHFSKYTLELQLRLIYNLFVQNNIDYDRTKIQHALDFINKNKVSKSGKTLSLNKNLFLFVNNLEIKIIIKSTTEYTEILIDNAGEYQTSFGTFVIMEFRDKVSKYPSDKELCAYVDLSGFNKLTLRTRKDGDIIKPLGCCGTQKLKKYLNEKKIPAHEKDKMIFLASETEILWSPSIGLSDKIKVVTHPTHVIKLIKNK